MMNKKIAALAAVLAIAAQTTVLGDGISISAGFDAESGKISLRGSADGEVFISVIKKGVMPSELSDENLPVLVKQINADKSFATELYLPEYAESGVKYAVYASCADGEASASFIYINDDGNEIVQKLKNAKNAAEFTACMKENALKLGIDEENAVYSENADKIAAALNKAKFDDVYEFNVIYMRALSCAALAGKTEEALSEYAKTLAIDVQRDIYGDERLSENDKKTLTDIIHDTDFMPRIEFADFFSSRLEGLKGMAALRNASSWGAVKRIITEDFKDEYGYLTQSEKYMQIKDKDAVFKKIKETGIGDGVERAFEAAADAVFKAEHGKKGGFGASAGGSGGGVTTPTALPEKNGEHTEETADYKGVFADVAKEHWAAEAVEALADKKIISGFNGLFEPSREISRAEFAKIISLVSDGAAAGKETDFSDVGREAWYFEYVKDAALKGLILGNDGFFRPNESITREDAALIVYRWLTKKDGRLLTKKYFSDRSSISEYAREAVEALAGAGILKGNENGGFKPKNSITRAEAAQLIYAALQSAARKGE